MFNRRGQYGTDFGQLFGLTTELPSGECSISERENNVGAKDDTVGVVEDVYASGDDVDDEENAAFISDVSGANDAFNAPTTTNVDGEKGAVEGGKGAVEGEEGVKSRG